MFIASSVGELPESNGAGVTIGNFDGVHKGHQALIHKTLTVCRTFGLNSVLVTFWPHPRCVVAPQKKHAPLSSRKRRMELLAGLGATCVLELPFTREMAALTPEGFLCDYLLPLHMRHLVVGHDFTLGRNRAGTVDVLREFGDDCGFAVDQLEPVIEDGEVVSSTRLRALIGNGEVARAARLLGRYYGFSGEVTHGDGRGEGLGFPTANLIPSGVLLPAYGVYAAKMLVDDRCLRAVTNVGMRPTFEGTELRVESFLPDISENLYGRRVGLEFVQRLRDEQRFDSVDELKAQIARDVERACTILNSVPC